VLQQRHSFYVAIGELKPNRHRYLVAVLPQAAYSVHIDSAELTHRFLYDPHLEALWRGQASKEVTPVFEKAACCCFVSPLEPRPRPCVLKSANQTWLKCFCVMSSRLYNLSQLSFKVDRSAMTDRQLRIKAVNSLSVQQGPAYCVKREFLVVSTVFPSFQGTGSRLRVRMALPYFYRLTVALNVIRPAK